MTKKMNCNNANSNSNVNSKKVFFLPLNDGEMEEIRKALEDVGAECVVKRIGWGANVGDFREEIDQCLSSGKTPVLVEVDGANQVDGAIVVDHHNAYVGRPASLLQILEMIGVEPNRWQSLVAANDAAYFSGMENLGASKAEMDEVRAYDRSFQLVQDGQGEWVNKFSPAVEAAAEEAIANMVVEEGVQILHFKFDAVAAITDRLWQSGVPQNILILCDTGEKDYFGTWELCKALQGNAIGTRPAPWDPSKTETIYDNFGGWTGGENKGYGFWGGYADPDEVRDFVVNFFKK